MARRRDRGRALLAPEDLLDYGMSMPGDPPDDDPIWGRSWQAHREQCREWMAPDLFAELDCELGGKPTATEGGGDGHPIDARVPSARRRRPAEGDGRS